jgi:hypothetical protein
MKRFLFLIPLSIACAVFGTREFNGSSQYGALQLPAVTGYPVTMSIWARANSTNNSGILLCVQKSTHTARFAIYLQQAGYFRCDVIPTNGFPGWTLQSPSPYPSNTWHHICSVWASPTLRSLYVDGALATSSNDPAPMEPTPGIDVTYLGARGSVGSLGLFATAEMVDAAVWNIALTAAQVAALGAGADPRMVSSTPPTFYAPLYGESVFEPNLVGVAITMSNGPAKGPSGPGIYRP